MLNVGTWSNHLLVKYHIHSTIWTSANPHKIASMQLHALQLVIKQHTWGLVCSEKRLTFVGSCLTALTWGMRARVRQNNQQWPVPMAAKAGEKLMPQAGGAAASHPRRRAAAQSRDTSPTVNRTACFSPPWRTTSRVLQVHLRAGCVHASTTDK